jgi:N-acyl-D-amino-acid deacylase
MMGAPSWLLALAAALIASSTVAAEPSTLIVNARIVDGTGAAARHGAVRIRGDRIEGVGRLEATRGEAVLDAKGMVLAPGFIDSHSHHDRGLSDQPGAEAAVSQGVTTIIVGQDGASETPLADQFAAWEAAPAAVNIASYSGHNSIREKVMGVDYKRHATAAELERMIALLEADMAAGALGLSTGLEYDPGLYASKAEVLDLARVAARRGGRYISHIRSEDVRLWEALEEVVEIGRATGMPVQVSHMKLAMTDWWGQAPRYLAVLERARASGVKVTGDVYPYEFWQSGLTVLFPNRDFDNRKAAEFALKSLAPAEQIRLSSFPPEPALVGLTLAEVAARRGTDWAQTLMDLTREAEVRGEGSMIIAASMDPTDTSALIGWPYAAISSDGMLQDRHPRGAGAFTKVLRVWVRERKALTLEEAVRKMSGLPADSLGIADRGVIRPGAYADLVLFDPRTVSDKSSIDRPQAQSIGIEQVWVNGRPVWRDGKTTGERPGRVLRRGR